MGLRALANPGRSEEENGAVDHGALLGGRPQGMVLNAAGAYQLFRIGDAVASRNIHAAMFDALRLAKDL